jgi:hypothetical protein
MDLDLGNENEAWNGWRLRGRLLFAPDGSTITPERLRGMLWRDEMELRRAGFASRRKAEKGTRGRQYGPKVKVVIVDLADVRVDGEGAA